MQPLRVKNITLERTSYKSGCSPYLLRFDLRHATAPGFTVGFLRTSLLKLSGLARYYLTPAKAEAYSILDDAHQRHADLVLAAKHIEQQ